MGEQSSAVAMFRALVMMVCLIVIPLAALFGTSLPDAIKALKEGHWPTLAERCGRDRRRRRRPRRRTSRRSSSLTAGAVASNAAAPLPPRRPPDRAGADAVARGTAAHGRCLARRNDPRRSGGGGTCRLSRRPRTPSRSRRRLPSAGLASRRRAIRSPRPRTACGNCGATYYLLESLPLGRPAATVSLLFARWPWAGIPTITRPFEATEAEPLRAMSRVLQQVEAWGSGPKVAVRPCRSFSCLSVPAGPCQVPGGEHSVNGMHGQPRSTGVLLRSVALRYRLAGRWVMGGRGQGHFPLSGG